MQNPQLTNDGKLKHLLSIDGLPKNILNQILDTAESFVGVAEREVKKVPLLRGKTVCNLFFEEEKCRARCPGRLHAVIKPVFHQGV